MRLKNSIFAYLIKHILLLFLIILTGCSGGEDSSTSMGQLSFKQNSINTTPSTSVVLFVQLTPSSSSDPNNITANVTVSSSNNNIATVTPSSCGIFNQGLGWVNTCAIVVSSLAYGTATITASAPGFASATAQVTVTSSLISGILSFTPISENIALGSTRTISLNLVGSANVSNLAVTINNSDPSHATTSLNTCILSSTTPHCSIIVSGIALGSTTLTATANNYSSVTNLATVINSSVPGQLQLPNNLQVLVGNSESVVLELADSSGISSVNASLTTQNTNVTLAPNSCTLSTTNPECTVTITGQNAGSSIITAAASGYTDATMPVTVVQNPIPGTFYFQPLTENVTQGASTQISLIYTGGTGIQNVPINIATSNSNASISPTICNLGDGTNSSCQITIFGNNVGSTVITASATGYTNATNTVNILPSGTIDYGSLSLSPSNASIQVNSSTTLTLSLNGSTNVNSLIVSLVANTPGVVQLSPSSCTLSTTNNSCTIAVSGIATGSTVVTATATPITNPAVASISVHSNIIPGYLSFDPNSETVDESGDTTVNLVYNGGSNVFNVPVAISANDNNVTIIPTSCTLDSGINSSCQITILGNKIGVSTLTAVSNGYSNANNFVTIVPNHTVNYGTLAISPTNFNVNKNSSTQLQVSLKNSLNVESLNINLTTNPGGIVQLNPSSCNLSTTSNICSITVLGESYGIAQITATAANNVTNPATSLVQVINNLLPSLVWDSPTLGVGPSAGSGNTGQTLAILRLQNGTLNPVIVPIPANDPSTTDILIGGFYPNQSKCTLTSESPVCTFKVVNNQTNNFGESAVFIAKAVPNSQNIAPAPLQVVAANVISPNRKIYVINNCPFAIYPAISGGSPADGTCPRGTSENGQGKCFWTNPTPQNSFNPNSYLLNHGESLTFTIPAGNSMDPVGVIWGGGISARIINESSEVITSRCSTVLTDVGACPIGSGFTAPQTVAEFSLLVNGPDTYDIQNINGVTVPMSVAPSSYNVIPNGIDPYDNGIAGSLEVAYGVNESTGANYFIGASSWSFNPSNTIESYDDPSVYNLVIPGSGASCSESMPCSGGEVCGYSSASIDPYFSDNTPSYALVCGQRAAYLTVAAIWSLNPDAPSANLAPFQFNEALATSSSLPYPNSNSYPMNYFYMCNNGLQSGYGKTETYPEACGCSNWDGLTTPSQQCDGTGVTDYMATTKGIGFNSAWLNYVLPRVEWVKEDCPTCYAFQFDDPSSTFVSWTPYQKSASNPASKIDYTVTFCPNGIHVPSN